MSAQRRKEVTTPLGGVLPTNVAAIAYDHDRHPERGRLLDRINAHLHKVRRRVASSSGKRCAKKKKAPPSSEGFSFRCFTPGGTPIIGGSVGIVSNDIVTTINCSGYLISICPNDSSSAVIVLEIPQTGAIPCVCPTNLLDDPTINAGKALMKEQEDNRRVRFGRSLLNVQIDSVPVARSGMHGHLLLTGPNKLKGRVVDSKMLSSLEGGCLKTGQHSSQAYYTLDRIFSAQRDKLHKTARLIVDTHQGMRTCPVGRQEVQQMIQCGQLAVDSRLVYHRLLNDAIVALDKAGDLPPPSIDERILQLSIGGDPESMMVGRFLPCRGLSSKPDVTIRCACGFAVDGTTPPEVRTLLRRRCNDSSNDLSR
mmetsp:Transcript_16202/g.34199  ORF Transcript_16202/g.34199 Transcript_16202/m.34199 type:complete len:367 (-) Transcript_16202:3014-4114(-)